MRISVIIPVRNEADNLSAYLKPLQSWRGQHEIILVDGGSTDDSPILAAPWVDSVLHAPPGRAGQMNMGAAQAQGDVLLFLHADTGLPDDACRLIEQAMQQSQWGRFDVRLSGRHPLLRVVERMMNWRSCLTGIATGDQAIFVSRYGFEQLGGYPQQALMEDIELSRRLKRVAGRPACIHHPVITSSRRWEQNGIIRTILLMWYLRLAYFLGVPAARLARRYRRGDPAGRVH